jgi:TetR/AcrR family transcriptional repressor of nem operon
MNEFTKVVGGIESMLNGKLSAAARHQRALVISAAIMGGLAAARATAKADPGLSDDILAAVRQILVEIGSKSKPSTRKSQIKR